MDHVQATFFKQWEDVRLVTESSGVCVSGSVLTLATVSPANSAWRARWTAPGAATRMRLAREVSLQHQTHLGNPSWPLVSRQVHPRFAAL